MQRFLLFMQRTAQRILRYVRVWSWLVRYNARSEPLLLVATLFFGICARLGALVGFILSIRCAIWILTPETVPGFLKQLLPQEPELLFMVLVAVPGSVFLGLAIAQVLYSQLSLKLRNSIAEALTGSLSTVQINEAGEEKLRDRPVISDLAASIRATHGKIVTVEAVLINLLVTSMGLLIALTGGLLIDWFLMSTIALVGISFSVAMVSYRHLKSHALTVEQEEVRLQEQHEIEGFVNLSRSSDPDLKVLDEARRKMPHMLQVMSNQKSVDQKFTSHSTLFIDLGQAAIIMTFLFLLIDYSGTAPERISMLIILALMFRFLSSYLQAITHLVIKLGMHYPFIATLRTRLQMSGTDDGSPSYPKS